ncbi:MAG: GTP pyrophosphokinase family protein [Acutalibacteraceae bacterium]|nr:GTP pyrophosphokinase family protein [Acutalibacteraceae bacterium]
MEQKSKAKKAVKLIQSLDYETIEWIQNKMTDFDLLMAYYRCAMMEIETKFKVLNEEFSLEHDRNPISSIKSRIKSFESITEKVERKGLPFEVDSVEKYINDVAGIRVICTFPEDVYLLADALLKQDDIMLIRRKDYIAEPKENGYRSLHLIVAVPIYLAHEKRLMKVEIQLRTLAMDFWASLEHQLRYKKDFEFTKEMADELKLCAEQSAALDLRMEALRKQVNSQ